MLARCLLFVSLAVGGWYLLGLGEFFVNDERIWWALTLPGAYLIGMLILLRE
jgi:hypothetical protein